MSNQATATAALAMNARVFARRTGRPLNLADVRDLKAQTNSTASEHAALRLAVKVAKADGEYALVAR